MMKYLFIGRYCVPIGSGCGLQNIQSLLFFSIRYNQMMMMVPMMMMLTMRAKMMKMMTTMMKP